MSLAMQGHMRSALIIAVLTAAIAGPAVARDYQAFIVSLGSLKAGPGTEYPAVADVSPGEPVQVHGCLGGYGWCDVSFQGYRGWYDGHQLAYPLNGVRVPLAGFGGQAGVPVVAFSVEDYWGRFYRDRPFYRDRARWAGQDMPAIGVERVHGPVHDRAGGPQLPPTPALQPRPHRLDNHRDSGQHDVQAR